MNKIKSFFKRIHDKNEFVLPVIILVTVLTTLIVGVSLAVGGKEQVATKRFSGDVSQTSRSDYNESSHTTRYTRQGKVDMEVNPNIDTNTEYPNVNENITPNGYKWTPGKLSSDPNAKFNVLKQSERRLLLTCKKEDGEFVAWYGKVNGKKSGKEKSIVAVVANGDVLKISKIKRDGEWIDVPWQLPGKTLDTMAVGEVFGLISNAPGETIEVKNELGYTESFVLPTSALICN